MMLAKIIQWAPTRFEAIRKLVGYLDDGVATNTCMPVLQQK